MPLTTEVPVKQSGSGAALSSNAPLKILETFHGKTGNTNLERIAGTDF
jgi:hypothetical protein